MPPLDSPLRSLWNPHAVPVDPFVRWLEHKLAPRRLTSTDLEVQAHSCHAASRYGKRGAPAAPPPVVRGASRDPARDVDDDLGKVEPVVGLPDVAVPDSPR